ncbi:putative proton-dependent oligopeptide transporter family, MFS transporter superfamily [Helianthus annuus]|nr:putative proton-dependent oligopeptide transporter family, MFS transporter superfamily [Helianthus annuus]
MILILCLRAVNEAFEKVASYGLLPNMILYLTEVYNMQAVTGATILYIWSAFSNGLSLFGAFISDSYLGPFRVIAFGSLSTLLVSQNLCFFLERRISRLPHSPNWRAQFLHSGQTMLS